MKVVYIAGPFRAPTPWKIETNVRRAEEIALKVWRMGAAVICPHTNTRFFQGAAPDTVWLNGCTAILKKCDAIVLIPGWTTSPGARTEALVANRLGLATFTWPTQVNALRAWIVENT